MSEAQFPSGADPSRAELARIQAAYAARDAGGDSGPYRYLNPAYGLYIQLLESALLEVLREAPVELESAQALEVGCGSGYFVNRLADFGAPSVVGLDLMPQRIEAARARYPAHRFICANAAEMPLPDESFDLVTQFTCLSSVLDDATRSNIALDMWRVLRPGGVVISYDLRVPTVPVRLMRYAGARSRSRRANDGSETPTIGLSREELVRLFPAETIRYRSASLAFGLCRVAALSPAIGRALALVPPLREHAIALIVKPSGGPSR